MKLSKKTALYSLMLTILIISFILIYLFFFLPGLYVEYSYRNNEETLIKQHSNFLENKKHIKNINKASSNLFTFIIKEGNTTKLDFVAPNIDGSIELTNNSLQDTLNKLIPTIKNIINESNTSKFEEIDWPDFIDIINSSKDFPINLKINSFSSWDVSDDARIFKFKKLSDDTIILNAGITYNGNTYINCIGLTERNNALTITIYSVVAATINEIIPIVAESIPLIIVTLVLFVLIFASYFAKNIVKQKEQVSSHTNTIIASNYGPVDNLDINSKNEINQLAENIDTLYNKLRQQYLKMEHEHSFREVFLRAGSHQLKTPITVSLLLIDSMINQIGKYKDYQTFLPKVKEELLNMRSIIDTLLEAGPIQNLDNTPKILVNINQIINSTYSRWSTIVDNKSIKLQITGTKNIKTNYDIFNKLIEYIAENSIKHCDFNGIIEVDIDENKLLFTNSASSFDYDNIEHLFEPFVTNDNDGHGLGLYFAKFYANILDMDIEINYIDNKFTLCLYY